MSANAFNSIMTTRPGRNRFNLSHDVKMSLKMGGLYPTACIDVLPGDVFNIGVENMLRFAPLIAPVMHDIDVCTYWFFVPNRLIWPNWEDFITGVDTDLVPPYFNWTGDVEENRSLGVYMGLPNGIPDTMNVDAMPFAAYYLIYDEWFRDQNLIDEKFDMLVDGNNSANYTAKVQGFPLFRAWKHDYFTSALPFAQKGDTVTLPLVEDTNVPVGLSGVNDQSFWRLSVDGTIYTPGGDLQTAATTGETHAGGTDVFFDPNGTLSVNINEDAVSINTLREAFRMQEFLELDAVGGSRYTETIYAHFGVKSKDSRLQRPELVGTAKGKMVISEVLQTATAVDNAAAGQNTPVGNMAGHGISVNGGSGFNYRATEHGWLIGLINVQPRAAYQNGLPRKFSRVAREDYFWPKFAHIGEQEVKMKELYVGAADPDGLFGYIPRYSEYRYESNRVSGEMQSELAHWHLGRIFTTEPALNEEFIECDPSARIFAVLYDSGGSPLDDPDQIYAHIFNNVHASRLIPKYGKPML